MVALRLIPVLLFCSAATFPADSYAIVGGTVFRDSGLALPEAQVTLQPEDQPDGGGSSRHKPRKLTTVSSPRGEFTFRVPPVAAKYKVTVTAKGFVGSEKIIETHGGEERVEATFSLAPQSK